MTRRALLDGLLFTSLAATALACGAPVPFFLRPPEHARPRSRARAGRREDFPPGAARKLMLGDRPAIVLNDGELRALDARCTHQSCPVNWDAASMKLRCPCHGAVFSSRGEWLSGPGRRPLAALHLEVTAAGDVIVGD